MLLDDSSDLVNLHDQDEPEQTYTMQEMADMGIAVPVAAPEVLRAMYAMRRKLVAACLDREHDFLYTIAYQEQGKNREKMTTSYAEAKKFSETYKVPYKAVPKKSGIQKLADSFNIEAELVEQKGLPVDPAADYSYARYKVVAKKSGKTAIGVGWARRNERGFPMPEHHMIGLADTRAWGRAVLRLAGFGEAGAEEIGGDLLPMANVRLDMSPPPSRTALPETTSPTVLDVAPLAETRIPAQPAAPAQPAVRAPAPAPAPTPRTVQAPPEVIMPTATPITEAQVGKLSALLKAKLGAREKCVAWLKAEAGVDTTRLVPEAAYAGLVDKLEKMEAP